MLLIELILLKIFQ